MSSSIRMEKLCYSVGGRQILEDFDFCLERGVNRTILGVSGAGKTTILKLLLGLLQPDSGRVFIGDTCITGLRESQYMQIRKRIAIVFQGGALFDSMTVGENVGYRLFEEGRLSQDEIERIVQEKLRFVGVDAAMNLYPAELSGGMKKRVALARALLLKPKIILFDEPTTGLDPIIKKAIHQLIRETHARYGFTAVIVSHEIPDIFDIAQNVAMLYKGRLLQYGKASEIINSDNPVVSQFISGSLDGPIQML